MSAHKVTQDSMGAIEVPKERYYGAVTERARRNFQIGTEKDRMPISIIYSLAMIKEVAAEINYKSERITNEQSKAIAHACRDVYMGKLDAEFPLPIWQTGSGTQTNMNVNEVVANRATEILKEQNCSSAEVHPNDHVNCGQSTNDVFPTAINVAVAMETAWRVIPALEALANCMDEKAKLFANVIKIGRTHMQDAVPMSVGQELSAYVFQINQSVDAMKKQLPSVCELAVGGTAVGTGLNCAPGFDKDMCAGLSHLIKLTNQDPGLVKELLPIRFTPISNKFAGLAGHDALVQLSGCFNCAATALTKIAKDFTLLSSGPSCGIGEFVLPANEPGSSIMPGKVNPTQCEALNMVCCQVMGNHFIVTMAASQGILELNVYKPVIASNMLHSCQLLADAVRSFTENCLRGLLLNRRRIDQYVNNSLMLVTVLTPHIGYDKAALLAKTAQTNGITLREAAVQLDLISADEFDRLVKPEKMAFPRR